MRSIRLIGSESSAPLLSSMFRIIRSRTTLLGDRRKVEEYSTKQAYRSKTVPPLLWKRGVLLLEFGEAIALISSTPSTRS